MSASNAAGHAPASLLTVPTEIVLEITSHLSPSELPALLRVNRDLNSICTAKLYSPVLDVEALRFAGQNGSVAIAKMLIERYHVDVNTRYFEDSAAEMTMMHTAAARGFDHMVRYLLSKGSGTEECSSFKNTPLHCAANCGRLDVVRMLVEAGADINAQDDTEGTPLHGAARVCRQFHTAWVTGQLLIDVSTFRKAIRKFASTFWTWAPILMAHARTPKTKLMTVIRRCMAQRILVTQRLQNYSWSAAQMLMQGSTRASGLHLVGHRAASGHECC